MLRVSASVAMWSAIVLCASVRGRTAEERKMWVELPKGTKAVTVTLHEDQRIPDGAEPGTAVDIVGEIGEPIKTGIAVVNVQLLAISGNRSDVKRPQVVVVQLTSVQREVLVLMNKHGVRLGIRVHAKEKPQP